jgi:hypothetical protein
MSRPAHKIMQTPPLDPNVADSAPEDPALTSYDEQHVVTYMRLLQAESEGADWREVARIVLHIEPEREPDRAHNAYQSHLARAKWLTEEGRLFRGAGSN